MDLKIVPTSDTDKQLDLDGFRIQSKAKDIEIKVSDKLIQRFGISGWPGSAVQIRTEWLGFKGLNVFFKQ